MDNYIELAKQYLARKQSKKENVFKKVLEPDCSDIDSNGIIKRSD
jgi:hypothetical protein